MYSINHLKKDVLVQLDATPYRVVDSTHVKLARGGAVVRTKLKNLLTGAVLERTFRPSEKVTPAELERRSMQFLYRENQAFAFMDQQTYEQETVQAEVLGDQARFLAEGHVATLLSFEGRVIGLEMANSVPLKVSQTEAGIKGDTATASLKPATVETGVVVNVPLFIKTGDVIKVDTRTGAYLERAK